MNNDEQELLRTIDTRPPKYIKAIVLIVVFFLALGVAVVWSEVRRGHKTVYMVSLPDNLVIRKVEGQITNEQAKALYAAETIVSYRISGNILQVYNINSDAWVTISAVTIEFE